MSAIGLLFNGYKRYILKYMKTFLVIIGLILVNAALMAQTKAGF